ncbi:MAG TPA: ATP-binding protein [Bryobacteraceae bacterium]|nr:ATP-binding protein [Bryobacteraceae bacterium]
MHLIQPKSPLAAGAIRSALVGCTLTVAAAALAIPLRTWLQFVPSSLFVLAVVFASWYGGKSAGLIATGLSVVAMDFVLMDPLYTLAPNLAYLPSAFVFASCALVVAELTSRRRAAERELVELNRTLENRVETRTRELQLANEKLRQEVLWRTDAERELARKHHDLLDANGSLSEFASTAAHDLQEPLRTVVSFSQLLQRRYGSSLPSDGADLLNSLQSAGGRMQRLLEDLLAYARADSDLDRKGPVSLTSVAAAARDNLRGSMESVNASVRCDPLPDVIGNETQLVQVFQNLISNALKYRRHEAPYVHVWAYLERDNWVICVRDNGAGFEQSDADQIFRPLKRLHGREVPGTGMGLAICRRIVERHGGRIWAESVRGDGTVFRFTLPHMTRFRAAHDSGARMETAVEL